MRDHSTRLAVLLGAVILGGCSFAPRPTAVATADPRQGYAPLEVAFDASASSTPAAAITDYSWDFGDGTTAAEPAAVHAFAEKGTHHVTLEIVDSAGDAARDTVTIRVLNRIPHAEFYYSPYGAPRDHPVTFDASASYDPDGAIADYVWDFGDETTAHGVRVDHVFPYRLEYLVTLTVADDDGAQNASARIVIVAGCDTCG
ncbi:PKD domain-containing protein [Candidatus Bipolaricaulota bacterium]|nr:PKD domain-containing protein [Candidatus Bipolaricaulota bacterium]